MNKVMNICFISDDKFVTYIGTLIVSILKNASQNDNFCFHLIGLDIKEENKNKLLMLKEIKDFEIKFYKPNYDNIEKYKRWQETFKKNGYPLWHYSVFIKLDIPFILKDLDNVLFIDADSIVLGSLDYIFNIDISNYSLISQKLHLYFRTLFPNLYKYMQNIGYEDPENSYIGSAALVFNIKKIKEIFTEESYYNKIDECMNKYISSIFTDEHIFSYIFINSVAFLDLKVDNSDNINNVYNPDKIIISDYFAAGGKPLNLNFNKPINEYYYKFWEYFSLTPFFKENCTKYMDIFYTNKIKAVLYKLADKIVWYLPFKKMRDNMRRKIIEEIDKILKYE